MCYTVFCLYMQFTRKICKEGEKLENYTKYALKATEELKALLSQTDNIFVIACGKCFNVFETTENADCQAFLQLAAEMGKTVVGVAEPDFLCNKARAEGKLVQMIPANTEAVFVIACGLGIQTVADLVGKPVFSATDSLNYTGHHGMALTKKACDACAQC